MQDGLIHPITSPGDGTGCVVSTDINHGQLFGWETFISFVLVVTVFAGATAAPFTVQTVIYTQDGPHKLAHTC